MDQDLIRHIQNLTAQDQPYAVATVIAVRGSASAKPGAKALINAEGKNLCGWVGGGCADAFVRAEAVKAMAEGRPRIVVANLDDEIFGLGMPCGGVMDVYIEPHAPRVALKLMLPAGIEAAARHLARGLGYDLEVEVAVETPSFAALLVELGLAVAVHRSASLRPLSGTDQATPHFGSNTFQPSELVLCGASRITEELARLGTLLRWPVSIYASSIDPENYPDQTRFVPLQAGFRNFLVQEGAAVIVASHHKGDPDYIERSLAAGAAYVGMIASQKRSKLIGTELVTKNIPHLTRLRAPAGLDIGCRTPADIALSVFLEILTICRE